MYNMYMNYILTQEQINHFMNEAGNGDTAQDLTLVQPTDLASEDSGGNVSMGDIGNDINTIMETAHLGMSGARLAGSLLAKRGAGMTEDAVNPFYGTIANKLAQGITNNMIKNNISPFTGNTTKFSTSTRGAFAQYGAKQYGMTRSEFVDLARNQMGMSGNAAGKEMFIASKVAEISGNIGKVAGIGGTGLGLAMTGATWKQSDKTQKAGGVLSGAMSIAGLIAAPFTGGASLGLNIGAAAIGVGTGFA